MSDPLKQSDFANQLDAMKRDAMAIQRRWQLESRRQNVGGTGPDTSKAGRGRGRPRKNADNDHG